MPPLGSDSRPCSVVSGRADRTGQASPSGLRGPRAVLQLGEGPAARDPGHAWYGMHMYSERTQVLLSPEQLARLKRLATREGKSVGAVIREAVDAFIGAGPDKRRRALETLFAMELPVDDWEVMKAEIEGSRYPDLYPEPES
jgi:hypothetical protein